MPMTLDAIRYTVRPGDNLSRIAQERGYADWKAIYLSDCNAALRQRRRDANLIQPGDVVMLPPKSADVQSTLKNRLAALQALRRQVADMYGQIERELDSSYESAKGRGEAVDTAAKVLGILTGLGKITVKGMAAMKLSGHALAEANKELGKEAVKFSFDPVQDVALEKYGGSLKSEDSLLWALPKVVVQSWIDMTTPSYWANIYAQLRNGASWSAAVTTSASDIRAQTLSRLKQQQDASLRGLDAKIVETNRLLGYFTKPVSTPIPISAKP